MEKFRFDLLHAARALARRPAYAAAVCATLALVIGANAAIFAVVNATLLRPVPFTAGERAVAVYLNAPGTTEVRNRNPLHAVDLLRFRQWSRTMTRFESFILRDKLLTDGDPEVVRGALVTAGLFEMMGASAHIGRLFAPAEDVPKSGVAVISYGIWQRRFGGDPQVLGRRILVDGEPHAIVGVLRRNFPPPFLDAEVFTPFGITEKSALDPVTAPSTFVVTVAQLAEGVTLRQASEEVDAMTRRLAADYPRTHAGWTGGAWSVREWLYGEMRLATLVLMAATAGVLLIACANIANLTLAQAIGRRHELSLRLALGASRRDLLRLQSIETLIVSGAGTLLGLLLAHGAVPALLAINPPVSRTLGAVAIDWRVQAFTVALGLVAALLSGILPSVRAIRGEAASAIAEGSPRSAGSRSDARVRSLLLVGQSAMCVALLVAGGVLLRSLQATTAIDPGFRADHVLTAQLRFPAAIYATPARRAEAVRLILERIRALPGVVAASTTQNLFQPGFSFQTIFHVEHKPTPDGQPRSSQFRRVSTDYFRTMRIRLLAGRSFSEADTADRPLVAMVSRRLADQYWPGEDAVGRRIQRGTAQEVWVTIIGVVDDVRDVGIGVAPEGTLYVPYSQANTAAAPVGLVVRTEADPSEMAGAVRAAVLSVDPELPIHRVGTLEGFLDESLAPQRFRTLILGLLAGLGLMLSAIGIYGVMARGTAERTREFGVRLALGSAPAGVLRLVLTEALRLVSAGAALGLAAGVGLTLLLGRVLSGVAQPDVATGAAAAALLVLTASVAAAVPAARALRLDPVAALRAG